LLDTCLAFIDRHTKKYQVVIGTRRHIWSEYPEEVLREAMLNALAHRDYGSRGSTVDVTVWEDRLEIRSPGGLPGPITLDNIRHEHYSRNRRIMRALKMIDLVEEYGEGIDRMFDLMEARLMEPPLITPTASSVSVTLRNRFMVSVEEQAWLAALGHIQLTPDERRVLAVTRREGSITRRRIRQLLPNANADGLLRGAVAKGLLLRRGQAGGVRYVLSDEVVMRAGSSGVEAQTRKRQTAEGADLLDEDMVMVRHLLNDLVAAGDAVARGQTRARRYFPS
jgi:ATP-dependent DNA helicase RecG